MGTRDVTVKRLSGDRLIARIGGREMTLVADGAGMEDGFTSSELMLLAMGSCVVRTASRNMGADDDGLCELTARLAINAHAQDRSPGRIDVVLAVDGAPVEGLADDFKTTATSGRVCNFMKYETTIGITIQTVVDADDLGEARNV